MRRSFLHHQNRRPRRVVEPVAYVAASALALSMPLLQDPGYEFAAFMALVASLVSGFATLFRETPGGKNIDDNAGAGREANPGEHIVSMVIVRVVWSAVPLAVGLPFWAMSSGCGAKEAVTWYALLVFPSALISSILGFVTATFARRRFAGALLFLGLWFPSLVRGAYEAITGPHIFLYAWQIGYFPGGSWDAALPIPLPLVAYRLALIVGAAGLLAAVMAIRRLRTTSSSVTTATVAGLVVSIASVGYWMANRVEFGYSGTYAAVEEVLADTIHTRLATIHFNRATSDSLDVWQAARIADSALNDNIRFLGLRIDQVIGTRVYLYGTEEEQRRLIGAGSLAFTKPWQRTVQMNAADAPRALRHELAHVAFAPFGRLLGLPFEQGLLEGSAVAREGSTGWRSPQEYARDIFAANLLTSADRLMTIGGFASVRPQLAYKITGAFSAWLMATRGVGNFERLFGGSDYEDLYGISVDVLARDFVRSLDSLPMPDSAEIVVANYLFGGGGFFLQRCLRRIGVLNSKADRARERNDFPGALALYRESLSEGVTTNARAGVLRCLYSLGRWNEFLDSVSSFTKERSTQTYLGFEVETGDAYWWSGDIRGARERYERLFRLDVSRALSIRCALRLRFLRSNDALRNLMRNYFTRPLSSEGRSALLTHAITNATDADDRLLLALMLGTQTVRRSPLATITAIDVPNASAPTDSLSIGRRDIPFKFAVRELCREFVDARAYAVEMGLGGRSMDPAAIVRRFDCGDLAMPSRSVAAWR